MRQLNVKDETGKLKSVIVGLGSTPGPVPRLDEAYDAKTYSTIIAGNYPSDAALNREVEGLATALKEEGIEVLRPQELPG
ncbi:MAG: amidinotransferase, partial [Bacteroidales bacterium]|nr:amidinotransferase [Bacteroidales bacterium]MDY3067610.1 amidinotransferase [Porphyromonas sp.]